MEILTYREIEPDAGTQEWCEEGEFSQKWRSQEQMHQDPVKLHSGAYIFQIKSWKPLKFKIDKKFKKLAEEWEKDTMILSSIHAIISHPAYLQIIAMGKDALPLIFKELKQRPGLWFWALEAITGENPVRESEEGNVRLMIDAWLRWAGERGL